MLRPIRLVRSLAVYAAALIICAWLLDGFAIDGPASCVVGALAFGLPTYAWMLALDLLGSWEPRSRVSSVVWAMIMVVEVSVFPLALATCLPGLLTAEWASPGISIDGGSTYLWACLTTSVILLLLGEQQPLRFMWRFWTSPTPPPRN